MKSGCDSNAIARHPKPFQDPGGRTQGTGTPNGGNKVVISKNLDKNQGFYYIEANSDEDSLKTTELPG